MENQGLFRWLAGICVTIMTLCYGLFIANVIYPFIPADSVVMDIMSKLMFYGPLSLCAICSVSLMRNKALIVKIITIVVWAAIIIFSFFPDTFNHIVANWVK